MTLREAEERAAELAGRVVRAEARGQDATDYRKAYRQMVELAKRLAKAE